LPLLLFRLSFFPYGYWSRAALRLPHTVYRPALFTLHKGMRCVFGESISGIEKKVRELQRWRWRNGKGKKIKG